MNNKKRFFQVQLFLLITVGFCAVLFFLLLHNWRQSHQVQCQTSSCVQISKSLVSFRLFDRVFCIHLSLEPVCSNLNKIRVFSLSSQNSSCITYDLSVDLNLFLIKNLFLVSICVLKQLLITFSILSKLLQKKVKK